MRNPAPTHPPPDIIPAPTIPELLQLDKVLGDRLLLKVGEVAELLNVADQQVIDFIEEGELVAINVGSAPKRKGQRKFWRIPRASLAEFLEERKS